jgi:hypothetical protein
MGGRSPGLRPFQSTQLDCTVTLGGLFEIFTGHSEPSN